MHKERTHEGQENSPESSQTDVNLRTEPASVQLLYLAEGTTIPKSELSPKAFQKVGKQIYPCKEN